MLLLLQQQLQGRAQRAPAVVADVSGICCVAAGQNGRLPAYLRAAAPSGLVWCSRSLSLVHRCAAQPSLLLGAAQVQCSSNIMAGKALLRLESSVRGPVRVCWAPALLISFDLLVCGVLSVLALRGPSRAILAACWPICAVLGRCLPQARLAYMTVPWYSLLSCAAPAVQFRRSGSARHFI